MTLDLHDLFYERDSSYEESTKNILSLILKTLEGIVVFMKIEEEAHNGMLRWEEVELISDEQYEEDVVLVTGRVIYNIGQTVALDNGEDVVVTEGNQDYLNRMIRIGLPFSIAEGGTTEEVVEFLEEMDKRRQNKFKDKLNAQQELDALKELDEELNTQLKKEAKFSTEDFDLDGLTEEQKKSYLMYIAMQGKQ